MLVTKDPATGKPVDIRSTMQSSPVKSSPFSGFMSGNGNITSQPLGGALPDRGTGTKVTSDPYSDNTFGRQYGGQFNSVNQSGQMDNNQVRQMIMDIMRNMFSGAR